MPRKHKTSPEQKVYIYDGVPHVWKVRGPSGIVYEFDKREDTVYEIDEQDVEYLTGLQKFVEGVLDLSLAEPLDEAVGTTPVEESPASEDEASVEEEPVSESSD